MTAYLYPISTGGAPFETGTEKHTLRVIRPWASADEAGSLHVISCLAVFQKEGRLPPTVTALKLRSTDKGALITARVGDRDFSLSF